MKIKDIDETFDTIHDSEIQELNENSKRYPIVFIIGSTG